MAQLQEDEKWYVRAQLALEELKSAKRNLAELEMAYEEEDNAWNTMIGGLALFGVAFFIFLVYQGFFIDVLSGYEGVELLIFLPLTVIFGVLISVWIGCAPAGFMGLWRAMRSSGWFVVGGGYLGIVLLLLFAAVPFFAGPVCLKRQRDRVRGLKAEILAAKKRLAAARAAVS